MSDWNLPIEGGCRCGQCRFRITEAPFFTAVCHCDGCKRMTASAFSLSIGGPASGFEVLDGEPVIGGLHADDRHFHCPHCLSWMFTRPAGMDEFVNVRAALLDDPSWFAPFIETYASAKLPWVNTSAPHSYDAFPPMEDFGRLMEEFAMLGGQN